MLLYDYRGERLELRPGELLQVTAKLRRADLIRGEKSGNYLSRNILLTGTVRELTPVGRCHPTIRTIAADLSARLSRYAAGFFSPDTSVFLRALLLGDKSDFYDDLPLYAAMRGAGFMHVVAVSGVQYLIFGFYRIARKPVNWALFGTRLSGCREKLRFI